MRRTAEILTTLILFAVVMTGLGWAVSASTPSAVAWLDNALGRSGAWIALIAVWLAVGLYAWRAHRPKAGKAGKAAGR